MILGELQSTLQVTSRAKAWIENALAETTVPNAILGILWGKWESELSERWSIGIYNRETVSGWMVSSPEFEFVIVQDFLISRLNGKTLDIDSLHIKIE
jgi:hypothetical protein